MAQAANRATGLAGRTWSWAALAVGVVVYVLALPTFGLSAFLSPIGLALSGVAWWRTRHDVVFWVGLGVNGTTFLWLLGILIGVLTGDVGVGWD